MAVMKSWRGTPVLVDKERGDSSPLNGHHDRHAFVVFRLVRLVFFKWFSESQEEKKMRGIREKARWLTKDSFAPHYSGRMCIYSYIICRETESDRDRDSIYLAMCMQRLKKKSKKYYAKNVTSIMLLGDCTKQRKMCKNVRIRWIYQSLSVVIGRSEYRKQCINRELRLLLVIACVRVRWSYGNDAIQQVELWCSSGILKGCIDRVSNYDWYSGW